MIDTEAIRKRAEAATPDVWISGHNAHFGTVMMAQPDKSKNSERVGSFINRADAEFFVCARQGILDLLDELEKEKAKIRDLLNALTKLKMAADKLTRWPFNLEHASDGQYDTFLEHKNDYERADFEAMKLTKAIQEASK